MNEPTQTTGRHPFVIVRKYVGGTRIHITDDPMYEWSVEWGVTTNEVDALCGLHTRLAVPADPDDYESDEMKPCPKCHRPSARDISDGTLFTGRTRPEDPWTKAYIRDRWTGQDGKVYAHFQSVKRGRSYGHDRIVEIDHIEVKEI